MKFLKILITSLSAAFIGSGLINSAFAQDQAKAPLIKMNIGGPSAGYWGTYLAEELGIYQKHGIDPKFYWFTSGAPLLAGLKSGSIDQTVTGLATVFALGQNIPLTIVSWEMDHGKGEGLIVGSKSQVQSYKDIAKAKLIGVAPGTCSQVSLRLIAHKAGVSYDKLNTVNLAPPLFANSFTGGSIDAAVGWAPWSIMGGGTKVASWDAEYGGVCPSINAFRPDFLKKHPDAAIRLLKVQAETQEIVRKNPQLAINVLQKYLKLPESVAKKFYELHSGENLPTFAEQLDPESQFSLVSKNGGLAKQLYVASQMLHEAGTIPAPLTWASLNTAIDASHMKKFVSEQQTAAK